MFVLREAISLGLTGTVRNMRDGRVEVVAEGGRAKLEQLLAKVKTGPPGSLVQEVSAEWESFEREFDRFDISYD